ncbi:MAG: hypothetical protein ACM3JD_02920 [Rudaea sp.]
MPKRTVKTVKRKGAPPRRDNQTLLIAAGVVGVVVVALLIAVNVFAQANNAAAPVQAEGRIWGNPNAPITIEEWSDFQ